MVRVHRSGGWAGAVGRPGGRAGHAATVLLCAALAGCEIPKDVDPVVIYREVTGEVDEARLPPPGLDQPFPNLAVVPPRPERPPLLERESISAGLAADRERSKEPLPPRRGAGDAAGQASPGEPPIPAAPPPRASLAGAPAIPWTQPEPRAPGPAAVPAAAASGRGAPAAQPRAGNAFDAAAPPAALAPAMPDQAPAPPPPDLLGPPGRPPADLLAPPAPPPPDLLAPARPR